MEYWIVFDCEAHWSQTFHLFTISVKPHSKSLIIHSYDFMTLSHTTGFPSVSSPKRKFTAIHVRIHYCSPTLRMLETDLCSLLTTAMVRIFLMFTQVYGTWTWSVFHKLYLLLNVYIMCIICINVYYKVLLGIINFTKFIIKTFFSLTVHNVKFLAFSFCVKKWVA